MNEDWFNNPVIQQSVLPATGETILMVGLSAIATVILGLPLGMALVATRDDGVAPNAFWNRILGFIVNVGRSIPFIILLILVLPLTSAIMGTTLGWRGMVFPLTLASVPFFARLVETNMLAVDPNKVEGALMMGASRLRILWGVQVREAMPSIIQSITVLIITLIGYSAMGGAVGGGGLGALAYNYGYQRYMFDVLIVTVVVIVIIVQLVQMMGDMLSRYVDHR